MEDPVPAALGERLDHPLHRTVRTTINGQGGLATAPTGPDDEEWITTDSGV